MSCRMTPAGSAFLTYTRLKFDNKLVDGELSSLFHELKRIHENRTVDERKSYTAHQFLELLNRQHGRIDSLQGITEAKREGLHDRLNAAASGPTPDQATLYALHNLVPRARKRAERLTEFITLASEKLNLSPESVLASFRELEDSVRGVRQPITYTPENRALAIEYKLGGYIPVVHAVAVLHEQIAAVDAAIEANTPPRIVRTTIDSLSARKTSVPNLEVVEYGHDLRNGRLEIKALDTETGLTSEYAYTNVFDEINPSTIGKFWSDEIRGNPRTAYLTEDGAHKAGFAPRCQSCGQFAGNKHGCPIRREPIVLRKFATRLNWAPQGDAKIELPEIRELAEALDSGLVSVESLYHAFFDEDTNTDCIVKGSIILSGEYPNPLANTAELICSCGAEAPCVHMNEVRDVLLARVATPIINRTRLSGADRIQATDEILARLSDPSLPHSDLIPEGRRTSSTRYIERQQARIIAAQKALESVYATDWARHEASMEEARGTWNPEAEKLYSSDFATFLEDYNKALAARAETGRPVIPYVRENALDGLATRASGQAFGVEIEYEFPQDWGYSTIANANDAIGTALYNLHLSSTSEQLEYHTASYGGYQNVHVDSHGRGTWSFENDTSVSGGEIVSPMMYDEPETWTKLEQVVKILRDNGAVPSEAAGGHVHVGTGFFQGSPAKYAELARLMNQHEDVIFRLASNPERGTHRGLEYTYPCPDVPPQGFGSISDAHITGRGALNYGNISGRSNDHPEFRVFDSTLDPGAIQAHIKLAVSMTHAASRIAESGSTSRPKEALGEHSRRNKLLRRKRHQEEHFENETASLRSFLDTVFRRHEDKLQLVSIFANTKWYNHNQSRRNTHNDDDD